MNLEEIARLSGVSRSTVSRVVNNSPKVSEEVRRRVLQVIDETNYHPNLAARGLAGSQAHILGRVIPTMVSRLFVDPYFPILIQGVTSACYARDYAVMLWLAEPEYERTMIHHILYSGLIDGVVISSMTIHDPLVDALQEAGRPFVMVGHVSGCSDISYVDVDNEDSARQATMHLVRLGYKRIATITGPEEMIAGSTRRQGYELALRQAGLPVDMNLIIDGDFTQEGGYEATERLLRGKPDAIFVASDAMAQGAYRALREADLRVPEDVAIVGFDDMPFAPTMNPPLTTVRQPIQRLGGAAAEMLIGIIQDGAITSRCVKLPTELVIRASCGFSAVNGKME